MNQQASTGADRPNAAVGGGNPVEGQLASTREPERDDTDTQAGASSTTEETTSLAPHDSHEPPEGYERL